MGLMRLQDVADLFIIMVMDLPTRYGQTVQTIYTSNQIYINMKFKRSPLLQPVSKPTVLMKKVFASIRDSVSPMTLCGRTCASTEVQPRRPKIRLINVVFLRTLSEIKLKRTDTTLDLSQKAKRAGEEKEKVERAAREERYLYLGGKGSCTLVVSEGETDSSRQI